MVLVFDLDDTLYEEATYAQSGMRAVARHLALRYGLPRVEVETLLVERLREGRDRVFDDVLASLGRPSRMLVRECLSVYRSHRPSLQLHPDAERCLVSHAGAPMYIVTDGHKGVQQSKVRSLGLEGRVRRVLITHRFGRHRAKPSPYCFELIRQAEGVEASDVVYVADNPHKDFCGIRPLGYRTVRIVRGMFAQVTMNAEFEAEARIASLDELDATLERLTASRRGLHR